MIVIERSTFRDEKGAISLDGRLRGTLQYGLRWYGEMEAQQGVTQRLLKELGDEHVLIRNQVVPGSDAIIPMILLSPQGVRAILPTPIRGIYRAKLDEWLVFDGSSRRFKRVRPNLQGAAMTMASQLLRFLKGQGYPLPEIEAVLIFTNPRTHVDTARPSVRIVLADAIDHFASNLQQFPAIMDGEDIAAVLESLSTPKVTEPVFEEPAASLDSAAAVARAEEARRALAEASAPAGTGKTGPLTPAEPEAIEAWAAGPSGSAPRIKPGTLRAAQKAPVGSSAASRSASQVAEAFVDAPLAPPEIRPLAKSRKRRGAITRRQWVILLAILMIGELLILGALAYLIIYGSPFG
jgi:hypothetical protein